MASGLHGCTDEADLPVRPVGGSKRQRMSRWTTPSASTVALLLLVISSAAEGKPTIRKSGDATTSEESTAAKQAVIRNLDTGVSSDVQEAAAVVGAMDKQADPKALKVCIMTADFWGLKSAGGTATAYHLLAAVLAKSKALHVTFLGVTKRTSLCDEAKTINQKNNLKFECLEPEHFKPDIVETYPYEQLSHAIVKWLKEDPDRCDVIHGHEWGGVFIDVIMATYLRQMKPGLRFAVEPHGGHFWSSQGQVQRPMDVISLRIDNQERMANMLNDFEISPTNYMLAFLRQRGWLLPNVTTTIPNIIPEVEPETELLMGREKPVWRLAFFSRLEERKGIKFFVEAINQLNVSNIPKFEVFFVGTEAKIDMRPSQVWIKEKTAHWPFRKTLNVGVKRDEALSILSSEGTLLVLCSLIDNMPYVVAEAAVKGIPFLAFDAGGVLEMFDSKVHKDNVVFEPTLGALSAKLNEVMQRGSIKSVRLSERVTSGRDQWLQWHTEFARNFPKYVEEDEKLLAMVEAALEGSTEPVRLFQVEDRHHGLDMWERICETGEDLTQLPPYLLMPPGYEFAEDKDELLMEMARLYMVNQLRGSRIGAMTFGAEIPSGRFSFPTSPTWMTYAGDDSKCMDNIPVLIRPETFCKAFLAEARVFRHYYSWVLAMLLGQQDIIMHAYPMVAFKVSNFTSHGYSCMPDKVPVDRKLTFPVASNLYKDAEELLRNLHLAPYLKPVVSLIDDFPTHQKHKGWQFGYLINDTSKQLKKWMGYQAIDGGKGEVALFGDFSRCYHTGLIDFADTMADMAMIQWLTWKPSDTGLYRDGAWACGVTKHEYPKMHHSLLHPCAGKGNACCGNHPNAPFLLRYESFFHSKTALLVLAYEVWPICGDGLDFVVRLTPTGPRKPAILLKRSYEPDAQGQPNRQKIEWRLALRTGDVLDFLVNPRGNHDCDGLYIVDIQIWTDNDRIQAP